MNRAQLKRILGTPGCRRLLGRLRDRLEWGQPLTGTITLADANEEERDSVAALLGKKVSRGRALVVPLAPLEANLQTGELCANLQEAVEAVLGPIENKRAAREEDAAAWEAMWTAARDAVRSYPRLSPWIDDLRSSGLMRKVAHQDPAVAARLWQQASAIAQTLPRAGARLASIAAEFTGDGHALDAGQPLATLLLRYRVDRADVAETDDAENNRRSRWAAFGIATDELSGPALALGLRPEGNSPLFALLRHQAEWGEPASIPLRLLLRHSLAGIDFIRGREVFVCENPTLISLAADRWGVRCAPFVCTQGMPNAATQTLLRQLAAAGAQLRYHGDFDWPGIRIAAWIMRLLRATPWRYKSEEYLRAPAKKKLEGNPVATDWDPPLAAAMQRRGLVVHEEAVAAELLDDLGPGSEPPA